MDWISIIIAIVTSITASLILSGFIRSYGILERLRYRYKTRRNSIKQLKKEYIFSGKLKPYKGSKVPQYYYNDRTEKDPNDIPIYYFFISENIDIEKFKAFLIPGLDYGHGISSGGKNFINEEWKNYLVEIKEKIKKSIKKGISVDAKRIVFIDKFFLDVFINESERVIADAGISFDTLLQAKGIKDENSIQQLARFIIRLAYYVMKIHDASWGSEEVISCYYVDKSLMNSNQYYDFGLYGIEGVDVVYNPIYLKGINKNLVRDQLYIGATRIQKKQIQMFENDFDEIWKKCEKIDAREMEANRKRAKTDRLFRDKYYSGISNDYYKQKVYRFIDFHKGYYKRIKEIFKEKLSH